MCRLTLNSYWIISDEEEEEKKLAPIEVVYVGGGAGASPKTGRKGMHRLLHTFSSGSLMMPVNVNSSFE